MKSCVFCRVAGREAPAAMIYEDETVVAFEDIHPQAPVHLLVIPRQHLESLNDITANDEGLLGHMLAVAARLAGERGLGKGGYRTVINNGAGAGQTVYHLHVHVLGGRPFHWPPG